MMISKILLWQGKLSIFKCFPQHMFLISKARYTCNKGLFAREQLCQPRGLQSASSPSRLRTETINDIDELFQNLNNSEHAVAESVKYAQLAPKLRHMIYSDLNCISWVNIHGDNYSSAYLQMLSLDMVDGLMEPLLSHPFFPTLLSQMQSCRFEMSDTEVLTTLSCLIQLGVKGEVVGQFWEEVCERCPSVSVHDLALVSQVLLNQSMFGFGVLTKLMMDRFLFAVDHGLYDGASDGNTAHDFAKVFLHLGFLFDEPTLYKLLSKLSDLMSNNCYMKTMDHVTSYLKCTWPVSLVSERCDTLISEIIDKAGRTLLRNIDILEYHHVSDISQTLKKKGIFTGDLVDQIHERSTNLLQSADKLTVVVHLLAAIKRRLEPGLHRSVNDFLARNISDVDLMTLQSLARIGTFQKPYSSQVDHLIQEELIKKMTQFIKFNFGTYSALIFILQSDKLDHQQFLNLCTSFNSHLSNCQLHSQLSIVFGILMKHIPDDEIPNYLQKKILELLPKWNLRNIGLFLIGFENRVKLISQSRSTLLKKQVLNIQNCLFESVSKNIEMEGHILPNTMFLYLILSCALNSNRDYAGISSIIDCFLSHPYKHSLHAVVALIDLFNEKRFFNSRLYDKFAELFVQFPVVKLKYIGSLIKCFGEAGHKPNNYKEFSPYLADIFNRYDVLGISHYSHKLQFVLNVCRMQHFPELMLKEIFSLPSLEIAEKEMMCK